MKVRRNSGRVPGIQPGIRVGKRRWPGRTVTQPAESPGAPLAVLRPCARVTAQMTRSRFLSNAA